MISQERNYLQINDFYTFRNATNSKFYFILLFGLGDLVVGSSRNLLFDDIKIWANG